MPAPRSREPLLLATAFRPFFLLAGAMAALWIPGWTAIWLGGLGLATDLTRLGWHVHEMVFGYTGAVLAGFLLTATRNWTRRETLRGIPLALLLLLWCGGRAGALHGANLPPWIPPAVDGAFFAAVAVAIARPILLARSWRNLAFPLIMAVLGGCDVIMHLHARGAVSPAWAVRALDLAIAAIAVVIILFGGRIVPMFTKNATGAPTRERGLLDWLGLSAVWIFAALSTLHPIEAPADAAAIAAGALNAARLFGWGGSRTARRPILWVLHLGWLFVCLGLIATGLSGFVLEVPPDAATHLLTIGGIGVLTIGMMARVTLGHTGRPLEVPRSVALAFALVVAAVLARAAAPLLPAYYGDGLWIASAAWGAGFALFTVRLAPMLLSPRVDGKPG